MYKVSVIGATGYAGAELVRLLCGHGGVEVFRLTSQSYKGKLFSDIYPSFKELADIELTGTEQADIAEIAAGSDVVFTALPHGASFEIVPKFISAGVKVIDFSGDFRYTDRAVYEKWYGLTHTAPELLSESVYGLPELHREKIAKSRLVGNPGCYTTCSILGLAPLMANNLIDNGSIIIDAKSGITGAGRSTSLDYNYCESAENFKAYKVATHRHTSEIEQELSRVAGEEVTISFTPHLLPQKRGILATCYASFNNFTSAEDLANLYRRFYANEPFVRIFDAGKLPETKFVSGSNYVDIGFTSDLRTNRVIVVSCLDNLIKGAAGQAMQNMNIVLGMDEKTGLSSPAFYL